MSKGFEVSDSVSFNNRLDDIDPMYCKLEVLRSLIELASCSHSRGFLSGIFLAREQFEIISPGGSRRIRANKKAEIKGEFPLIERRSIMDSGRRFSDKNSFDLKKSPFKGASSDPVILFLPANQSSYA